MDYSLLALCVSAASFVVSLLGTLLGLRNSRDAVRTSREALRNSQDAQHHTQIVEFEQRKQEIRRILLEQDILHGEIKSELDRTPDSDHLRDMISRVAIIRETNDATKKIFDEHPSSPSTDARLKLEQAGATVIESKERLQVLLKALRNENALREKNRR